MVLDHEFLRGGSKWGYLYNTWSRAIRADLSSTPRFFEIVLVIRGNINIAPGLDLIYDDLNLIL